jgi:hypothetical protein
MILGSKPQHSIAIAASKQAPVSVGLPYVASSVMHEAALRAQVAPVRLSLINSLSILRKAVFEFQIITESQKATQYDCLLGEIERE